MARAIGVDRSIICRWRRVQGFQEWVTKQCTAQRRGGLEQLLNRALELGLKGSIEHMEFYAKYSGEVEPAVLRAAGGRSGDAALALAGYVYQHVGAAAGAAAVVVGVGGGSAQAVAARLGARSARRGRPVRDYSAAGEAGDRERLVSGHGRWRAQSADYFFGASSVSVNRSPARMRVALRAAPGFASTRMRTFALPEAAPSVIVAHETGLDVVHEQLSLTFT